MSQPQQHWVRVGIFGHVGCYAVSDATEYLRAARVLCRTLRGLEVGEVLSPVTETAGESAGTLVRVLTPNDASHLARLALRSRSAYRTCTNWLRQRGESAVLMDVEHLFDGKSLYFYFVRHIPPNSAVLRQQLASLYGARIEFCLFEEEPATTDPRCGDCGPTEGSQALGRATRCRRGGCDSCAAASVCGWRSRNSRVQENEILG